MGLLHISSEALIHTIPSSKGKNMGKHKHFKIKGFLYFSLEAEIDARKK